MIMRMIDILFSLLGLLGLIIMLPFVALLIKLDSRGPVFYICDRVGLNGKIFRMYKFRTMHEIPDFQGPSVSSQGDPRVTTVGRVLRRLKLNEFPQFINVFKGEMTLVGPRPEAPDLAAAYPAEAQKIFSVKPGLIGPNQIAERNEEELYSPGVDPVRFYVDHILPRKLPLDLEYIADPSLCKNLKYLLLGAYVTVAGAVSRRHLWDNWSQLALLAGDAVLCLVSFLLAHFLRFGGGTESYNLTCYKIIPLAVLVRLPVFIFFGFYHTLIRYLSFDDIKDVVKGASVSSVAFTAVAFLAGLPGGYSRGIFLIDWSCLTTLLVAYRVGLKKIHLRFKAQHPPHSEDKKKVCIWGAGDFGDLC